MIKGILSLLGGNKATSEAYEKRAPDVYLSVASDGTKLGLDLGLCRHFKAVPVELLNSTQDPLTKVALFKAAGIHVEGLSGDFSNFKKSFVEVSVYELDTANFSDKRWLANGFGSGSFNEAAALSTRGARLLISDLSFVR